MFIARGSKRRDVGQFILAVLLVPTAVTVAWMSALGGAGIDQMQAGIAELADDISEVSLALFQMLANLSGRR